MEVMGFRNSNLNIKKREIIINKFIEKFPKTKLHAVIQVCKHYNKKNIELEKNNENLILTNMINNNLIIKKY